MTAVARVAGFRYEQVETIAAALALLDRGPFDVVVAGTTAVIAALRGAGHLVPIVALVDAGSDASALAALEAGATEYLADTPELGVALRTRLLAAMFRGAAPPYQRIVEATDEGAWIIDAEAITTYANAAMGRMLGYSPQEMVGRSLLHFMDEAGVTHARANLERRREGIGDAHDFAFRRSDGTRLDATLTTNSLMVAGRYTGSLAMVTDISDRTRAEERFRGLFEHSPIALWEEDGSELKRALLALEAGGVTDLRGYFRDRPEELGRCMALIAVLDVNQAALCLFEATDKTELLRSLERTLAPESFPTIGEQLTALAGGATVFEAETTNLTLTGRRNHVIMKTIVAPGCEQTLAKVYVSMVDITARKQAEDRVRSLALFPELNPRAVLRLDAHGAIAYANPAALELAQTLGVPLGQLLPPTTPDIVRDTLATGRRVTDLETRHGARTLQWSFHPVEALQIAHCFAVDITEQLQLEEQLRQSQKMDAIGHLAGGVAHDFNNLLTVITANTSMLQRAGSSRSLDSIAQAADRAAMLVRQLLAFSRQQVLQMRELELNMTIANLAKVLERSLRDDIEVRVELSDQLVWARADGVLLDQVLMNLAVNAQDAMPDGGSLELSTALVWLARDDLFELPSLSPGAYVRLRVRDSGTGIAPEQLSRIFDPFFTTKEPGKGTGLGLATVFGIVRQHGGALTVSSELGAGTTFSLFLPATAESMQVSARAAALAELSEPRGGPESILVVEDEESVRTLVREVLELNGYRVRAVSSGAEALRESPAEGFDLVLTDMIMPGGVSGPDLADRLRTLKPSVKVIYMSGYTGELAGRGLELREGVNFLPKPFGPNPLLACIRACLDAG